jgi:hypothetical protein
VLSFLSFVGGLVILVFALVGAFPCLRWGLTGVQFIWRNRRDLDEQIRREMREHYRITP